MADNELVKMSPKGQLVVPQEIREKEGFESGDRFMPFQIKDGILFKKVKIPDVKSEFRKLSKEVQKQFKLRGIQETDVKEAVRWARKR
ncbi:MAG: AbrB/MazE/SpoVT family DNA-binding domain-containing protein [Nanoarchaeota archaeon]